MSEVEKQSTIKAEQYPNLTIVYEKIIKMTWDVQIRIYSKGLF